LLSSKQSSRLVVLYLASSSPLTCLRPPPRDWLFMVGPRSSALRCSVVGTCGSVDSGGHCDPTLHVAHRARAVHSPEGQPQRGCWACCCSCLCCCWWCLLLVLLLLLSSTSACGFVAGSAPRVMFEPRGVGHGRPVSPSCPAW
jgi:hypothetical protein